MIGHIKKIKRVCSKCNGFMKCTSPPHATELRYVCENNRSSNFEGEDSHDVSESFHRTYRCFQCTDGKLELLGWGENPDKPGAKEYCYRCDLCLWFKFYDEELIDYD